jgi:carbamate kinase
MKIVVALGGNAIAAGSESLDSTALGERVRAAASAIADIARGHDVVVTHGNGPQVGLLALQAQAQSGVPGHLDVLGAEAEGLIGYLIERELGSIFPGSPVATLLTQVEVSADDPAFEKPTKPIGPPLSPADADDFGQRFGWHFAEHRGALRRVVPSPEPNRIRELKAIELCVDAGVLVICAGGGGIPVVVSEHGTRGVEAVIDKDLTAALLARELAADVLLLLTDVPAVYEDWPEPRLRRIRSAGASRLRELDLAPGSMGPKVEAACRFAEFGGKALIGSLDDARHVLTGQAGTQIHPGDEVTEYWDKMP